MKKSKTAKGTVQLQIKICCQCGQTFIGVVGLPYSCKDGLHLIKMDDVEKLRVNGKPTK